MSQKNPQNLPVIEETSLHRIATTVKLYQEFKELQKEHGEELGKKQFEDFYGKKDPKSLDGVCYQKYYKDKPKNERFNLIQDTITKEFLPIGEYLRVYLDNKDENIVKIESIKPFYWKEWNFEEDIERENWNKGVEKDENGEDVGNFVPDKGLFEKATFDKYKKWIKNRNSNLGNLFVKYDFRIIFDTKDIIIETIDTSSSSSFSEFNKYFLSLDLSNIDILKSHFSRVFFKSLNIQNTFFKEAVNFNFCIFININFNGSFFTHIDFNRNLILGSCYFIDTEIETGLFNFNTFYSFVNFSQSKLTKLNFYISLFLYDCDFSETTLNDVHYNNVYFSHRVDFRDIKIFGGVSFLNEKYNELMRDTDKIIGKVFENSIVNFDVAEFDQEANIYFDYTNFNSFELSGSGEYKFVFEDIFYRYRDLKKLIHKNGQKVVTIGKNCEPKPFQYTQHFKSDKKVASFMKDFGVAFETWTRIEKNEDVFVSVQATNDGYNVTFESNSEFPINNIERYKQDFQDTISDKNKLEELKKKADTDDFNELISQIFKISSKQAMYQGKLDTNQLFQLQANPHQLILQFMQFTQNNHDNAQGNQFADNHGIVAKTVNPPLEETAKFLEKMKPTKNKILSGICTIILGVAINQIFPQVKDINLIYQSILCFFIAFLAYYFNS